MGVHYVAPPLSLCRRAGREVVLAEGLGLIPVLGAYLVQVGDITRTVYLASLPIVVATGLWIWMDELSTKMDDERSGRSTLVIIFGPGFSGRCGVPSLVLLLFASFLAAALSGSVHPLSLLILLFAGLAWKIAAMSWTEYSCPGRMMDARKLASHLHLATCSIIAASSLATGLH